MRLSSKRRNSGLTLVEILVTLAVLLAILVVVMDFMSETDQAWKSAAVDPFAEAEDAFDTMTRHLATATLEPYQDYADSNGAFRTNSAFVPDHVARRSDLDFVCGPASGANGLLATGGRTTTGCGVFFLAPEGYTQTYAHTGMEHLLNAMGYYVEFGADDTTPSFISSSAPVYRWRLKQVLQPSESLQVFALNTSSAWIQQIAPVGTSNPVLADNIVTLIVLPERAANDSGTELASDFRYDSRDTGNKLTLHQLPSRLRVVLVAMDSASGQLLANRNGANPPALVASNLFQQAAQLDADLAALDSSLTAQKIGHRIYDREILLSSSNWSNTPSP